jgi:putative transposase
MHQICIESAARLCTGPPRAYVLPVPRYPRGALPNGIFHVTARGTARVAVFIDDLDRVAFLHRLRQVSRTQAWRCHAYCLMTNHYHLVLETRVELLSLGMQRLNGVYARGFNDRYERVGHLFEGRFSAYVIDDEDHLAAACLYILENPVRAGICARAEDWAWSGALGGD